MGPRDAKEVQTRSLYWNILWFSCYRNGCHCVGCHPRHCLTASTRPSQTYGPLALCCGRLWPWVSVEMGFNSLWPSDAKWHQRYFSTLVQIMAWCWPGDKPLSEPMMDRLPMYIYVIRPQWVHPTLYKRGHNWILFHIAGSSAVICEIVMYLRVTLHNLWNFSVEEWYTNQMPVHSSSVVEHRSDIELSKDNPQGSV